jgi:hypothetical protein
MAQDDPFAQLERLRSEAAEHRTRVGALATVDAKREIGSEVWPWLESFCDSLREMFEDQAQVIDELIDGGESAIDYDLAARIIGVFEVGKQLCAAAEQILPLVKLPAQKNALQQIIATFRAASAAITAEVAEATVPDGEPEEGGEDDDDDGEEIVDPADLDEPGGPQ